MTLLSPHFSLSELTKSPVAIRRGIDNTPPTPEIVDHMRALCEHSMEAVRNIFNKPVRVTSGFRCVALNTLIGGAIGSQHTKGEACDFEIPGFDNLTVARAIVSAGIVFDQLILEMYVAGEPGSGWIHLSYSTHANRHEVLTATRVDGKVIYMPGLP